MSKKNTPCTSIVRLAHRLHRTLSYVFVGQDLNRWEMIYEHPDCVEAPRPFYCWIYRELQRMKTSNPVTLINCMVDRLMLAQEMQIQGGKA